MLSRRRLSSVAITVMRGGFVFLPVSGLFARESRCPRWRQRHATSSSFAWTNNGPEAHAYRATIIRY